MTDTPSPPFRWDHDPDEKPLSMECVGCGWCCSVAPCPYSMTKYCVTHPCPALYWDGERYRCADVEDLRLTGCCAIGAGCSSTLFNAWRGLKIRRRPEIENPHPRVNVGTICDTMVVTNKGES